MNTLSISFWKALFSVLLSSVSQQYRFYTTRMVLVCFMEGVWWSSVSLVVSQPALLRALGPIMGNVCVCGFWILSNTVMILKILDMLESYFF